MEQTTCVLCEKELTGTLDTFGPMETPLCWDCWSSDDQPEVMKDLGGGEPLAGQSAAPDAEGPVAFFYTRP